MDETQDENDGEIDVYEALGSEPHEEPTGDKNHQDTFHNLAEDQKTKDEWEQQANSETTAAKEKIKKLLELVKKQIPVFEGKYKESDPELFEAFVSMVESVVELAKRV